MATERIGTSRPLDWVGRWREGWEGREERQGGGAAEFRNVMGLFVQLKEVGRQVLFDRQEVTGQMQQNILNHLGESQVIGDERMKLARLDAEPKTRHKRRHKSVAWGSASPGGHANALKSNKKLGKISA